jgi:hypothetical protein
MKGFLIVSLCLNVVLMALVVGLIAARQPATSPESALVRIQPTNWPQEEAPLAHAGSLQSKLATMTFKRFNWSQVESTNYETYVANLRSIGCPQQTIRDILTADIDTAYIPRREQIERGVIGSLAARQQADTQLAQLRFEEAWVLSTLLGETTTAPQSPPNARPMVPAARNIRAVMPLAFVDLDTSTLPLDQQQVAIVDQVRLGFEQELGAQDPNDPAYRQRWDIAQHNADDRLRGMLGSKVFIQYQRQAANQVASGGAQ